VNNVELNVRPAHVSPDRVVDFDIYQPMAEGQKFHEAWRALQTSRVPDIVWTPRNGGHWLVLRGKLIEHVLSDYPNFSSHTVLVPKETAGAAYKVIPITLDPPEHRAFRNLLNDDLSPKGVRGIEGTIRDLTIELIESFGPRGRCNFTKEFAEKLPIAVFMKMVDLPMEHAPEFKYLVDQITRPDGSITTADVFKRFNEYLEPVIRQRRGRGGSDMISRMISAKVDGRPLTDDEAINLSVQVLVGGLDTVVNFMGYAMMFLAQDPQARHGLAQNPEKIPGAVNEFLRRFGLITVGREVTHDMEFEGVSLQKGDMVMVPTMLHGLDDRLNADPLSINFNRPAIHHSTFGNGAHTCPGAHLAKTEICILLEEWLKRIPDFGITEDSVISFTGGIVASINPFSLEWDSSRFPAAVGS
jgi:cytochrome P450